MKRIGIVGTAGLALALLAGLPPARAQQAAVGPPPAADPVKAIRDLFAQGRWNEAVAALERAEAAAGPQEDLLFMRAMVAMETGDYTAAARLYERLLERYPDNSGLKNNLAWLRLKSDDPVLHNLDLALREAQEGVMAAPHDYNIWNTLAEVYLARGDAMKAMRLAVLARNLATLAGERDLRAFQDLVRRCETAPRPAP